MHELLEWKAYYHLKDLTEQIRTDEQAMAIGELIAHSIGGEGQLDLKRLFPRYPFAEETSNEASVESSQANVAKALGGELL